MREKNFELANKLEPERKMQPGRVLGLQPWQVAIWFLEPQLEKDHDVLKCQFDAVQDENDTILSYNRKLQAEKHSLFIGKKSYDSTWKRLGGHMFHALCWSNLGSTIQNQREPAEFEIHELALHGDFRRLREKHQAHKFRK